MTTSFMPIVFQAHAGVVHWFGRPLSEFTATRAKVALRVAALDAPSGSKLEAIYALAKEQVESAQRQAAAQSTNTTNPGRRSA